MDKITPVIFHREGRGLTNGSLARISLDLKLKSRHFNLNIGKNKIRKNILDLPWKEREDLVTRLRTQTVRVVSIGPKTTVCSIVTGSGLMTFNVENKHLERFFLLKPRQIAKKSISK